METKNRLPEKWSLKYVKGHPCNDRVFEVLEILDPERVLHWKEWITENCKSGEFINYSKSSGVIVRSESKHPEIGANEFVSLTEEKEEWVPKTGERILVSDDHIAWHDRKFICKNWHGKFLCDNGLWLYAKPTEQPKEVPFTPTVGKVCSMTQDGDDEEYDRVFLGELNGKFMGCEIDEYAELLELWPTEIELFDSVAPAKKQAKEVTFSEVAQAFETTVDKLKIKGYVNEQDAITDAKKILLAEKIADHKPGGKVLISIYEIIDP